MGCPNGQPLFVEGVNKMTKIDIYSGFLGAGKTTLTNLLLRLYDVTEGAITLNGIDIKEWDISAYHKNFAAVFQDFSLFGATLGENISMDDSIV